MADAIRTFEDFWPYYVRAHSNRTNRRLHFVGTSTAMVLAGAGLLTGNWLLIGAAPVVGYGCAWVGHFVFEKNVPASFGHPFYSFAADFVMWRKILVGEMDAEVEKFTRSEPPTAEATAPAPAAAAPN